VPEFIPVFPGLQTGSSSLSPACQVSLDVLGVTSVLPVLLFPSFPLFQTLLPYASRRTFCTLRVIIIDADVLVEQGRMTHEKDLWYSYTTTANCPPGPARVIVAGTDLPGHVDMNEATFIVEISNGATGIQCGLAKVLYFGKICDHYSPA
jgi:hypothetical protein